MEELRPLAGSDLILWGGVPGAMMVPGYPEEKLRIHVTRYLETMNPTPRFILGIGDQLPPNGDIERVRLIGEVLDGFSP
jgi:hypothetical protein